MRAQRKVFEWFVRVMYLIPYTLCKIIDVIISVFRSLCGLSPIDITEGGNISQENDILMVFLNNPIVKGAFWAVLFIGVVFMIIMTIVTILRGYLSEEKANHIKTLKGTAKGALIFFMVPILLFVGIAAVNGIIKGVDVATGGGAEINIGGRIIAVALDPENPEGWEGKYANKETGQAEREKFIESLITGKDENGNKVDYTFDTLKGVYDMDNFNVWLPLLGSAVCVIAFGMTAFLFVRRIWDVLTLFILSPIVIATMPSDDGARFKIWRDMIISKVLGCYGVLIVANIFLSLSSMLFSISIPSAFGGALLDGVVQLLFICGGALAISGANVLIANLIGSNAGNMESQAGAQMFRQVMGGAMLAGRAVGTASKAFRSAPGKVRKAYGGAKTALNGAKIGGMGIAAGASYLSAKGGHRGAETHDKIMRALQGKNYTEGLQDRLNRKKNDEEYHNSKGISKKEIRSKQRMYSKMFKKEEQNTKGGILGTKNKNKKDK